MLRLRAFILLLVGTPVMAGMVVGIPVLTARLWGTALLDGDFWLGSAVFGGLSLIALGLILRARTRVLQTGEGGPMGLLARYSPGLMVIGVFVGGFMAHRMARSALATHWEVAATDCQTLLGDDVALDTCMPVMDRCDAEARAGDGIRTDRTGQLAADWPAGLDVPDDPRTRAQYLCVWRVLGE